MLFALLAILPAVPGLIQEERVALVLDPSPGQALHKTLRTEHALNVDSYRRTIRDESASMPIAVRLRSIQTLEVVDEVLHAGLARPAALRRSYLGGKLEARLESTTEPPEIFAQVVLSSQIHGASVVFTWNEAEQEYGRYFDARELSERWLPDLVADLDLSALLPQAPVAVGETWRVDGQSLSSVVAPFGDQHLEEAPKDVDPMLLRSLGAGVGANLHQAFGGQSTGEVELELISLEGDLARIKVRIARVNLVRDMSDYTAAMRLEHEESAGFKPVHSRLAVELAGQGELVWNRAQRHAQSLELTLQEKVLMGVRFLVEETEVWDEIQLSGLLTQRFSAEPGVATPPPGPAVGGR